jgi:hypothetical protein
MSIPPVYQETLRIDRLKDGGYTVSTLDHTHQFTAQEWPKYACTTLAEALAYIRKKMDPKE